MTGYSGPAYHRDHIVLAERALGKPLPKGARVHHVDYNKRNNAPENLVICPSESYHKLLHIRTDALDACGHASWRKCSFCQQYSPPEDMYKIAGLTESYYHRACEKRHRGQGETQMTIHCIIEDCSNYAVARNLCGKHWARAKKAGTLQSFTANRPAWQRKGNK